MLRALLIDMPSGVSGDMLVASLLELSGGVDYLDSELKKLFTANNDLPELTWHYKPCNKQGLKSAQVQFQVPQESKWFSDELKHQSHHHRHLKDIVNILDNSILKKSVVAKAKYIFELLAQAEAQVHGVPKDKIHFHEVGALDAICDVVSVVTLIDHLKVDQVYASPVLTGQGTVSCAHGNMPVPVPAVVKLLESQGIPAISARENTGELSTPTGVAILAGLVDAFEFPIKYRSLKSGFGAGQRDIPNHVNVLRARLVEIEEAANPPSSNLLREFEQDQLQQIETNLDDMPGEEQAFLMEKLFQAGALDVWIEPIIMKKSRPAQKITTLVQVGDQEKVISLILNETSTLGVRCTLVNRYKFKRQQQIIKVDGLSIRIKRAIRADQVIKWKAEAEDVRQLCLTKSISWSKAREKIQAQYLKSCEQ